MCVANAAGVWRGPAKMVAADAFETADAAHAGAGTIAGGRRGAAPAATRGATARVTHSPSIAGPVLNKGS